MDGSNGGAQLNGAQMMAQAKLAGFSDDELLTWRDQEMQQMTSAGFSNDEVNEWFGKIPSARDAALEAGKTRMRPVVMTALAMILGMLPMALGLGEGGEQNAPLGRAVIGGLLVATVVTLFVVPVLYAWLREKPPRDRDREIDDEYEGKNGNGDHASPQPA